MKQRCKTGVAILLAILSPWSLLFAEEEAKTLQEVDEPPQLVRPIEVVYPHSMRMAGLEGTVLIEFIIDEKGRVINPHVRSSNNPWFERAALDALLKARFKPGRVSGRAVKTRAVQPITFSLADNGRGGELPWKVTKGDQSGLPEEARWDIAPEPVNTAFPVYPLAALLAGTNGQTRVNFVVGPNGSVVQAKVIDATAAELGHAVLAMLDVWQFKPARKKDGTPCFAILSFTHKFQPEGRGDVPVTESARAILRELKRGGKGIVASPELDAPPQPLSRRPPVYPLALRNAGQTGEAVIEFYIDAEGDAQLPRVVSASAPEFGYAAAQAVATWRFTPPRKGGKPAITRAEITVGFSLKD